MGNIIEKGRSMKKEKILEVISFWGSCASLVSLLFIECDWQWAKTILYILLVVLILVSFFVLFICKDEVTCRTKQKVKDFMKDWIGTDGVVEVLSRDLSWVDDEMVCVLANKGKDLHLYVDEETSTTQKIRNLNKECNIHYYSKVGFTPISRFTIVRANKDERQMAIAIKEEKGYKKFRHCIYISKGSQIDKKMLALASDLLQALRYKEAKSD